MRTPFVKNQPPSTASKTKQKVEEKNTADGKAVERSISPEPHKAENKTGENHTLLEEKVPSSAAKTRKNLFRK